MIRNLPAIWRIDIKIWIAFPERLFFIILQMPEHRAILHAMSVDDGILVHKVRIIIDIQEDCPKGCLLYTSQRQKEE